MERKALPPLQWPIAGNMTLVSEWYEYLQGIDRLLRTIDINAANDAAAAAAGVPIGSLYRNGSVVQIRVT